MVDKLPTSTGAVHFWTIKNRLQDSFSPETWWCIPKKSKLSRQIRKGNSFCCCVEVSSHDCQYYCCWYSCHVVVVVVVVVFFVVVAIFCYHLSLNCIHVVFLVVWLFYLDDRVETHQPWFPPRLWLLCWMRKLWPSTPRFLTRWRRFLRLYSHRKLGDTVDGSEILHPSQPSLSIGKTNLNMSTCPICTRNPWCRLHRVILGCSTDRWNLSFFTRPHRFFDKTSTVFGGNWTARKI